MTSPTRRMQRSQQAAESEPTLAEAVHEVAIAESRRRRCQPRRRRRQREEAWWLSAACRSGVDPEAFYDRDRVDDAKAVCSACPVHERCREHALARGETHGVWGGLDEDELAAARRRRAAGRHDARSSSPRRHEASRACYQAGCRREECRRANARYERARYARGGSPRGLKGPSS